MLFSFRVFQQRVNVVVIEIRPQPMCVALSRNRDRFGGAFPRTRAGRNNSLMVSRNEVPRERLSCFTRAKTSSSGTVVLMPMMPLW